MGDDLALGQDETFGQWVKRLRKALDLTQEGLARQVGCAAVTLRKIEADERRPSLQLAKQLEKHLELEGKPGIDFMRHARLRHGAERESLPHIDPWAKRMARRRISLPSPLTSLIGREEEAATVCERLMDDELRLLTLVGPPGVGKTRLSIRVGWDISDRFADGVCFVALAPVQDASMVVATIAQTLGLAEIGDQPLLIRLANALQDKRLLLVLDNFEHVMAAAPAVTELLANCPLLKVLATSREALRVSGEEQFTVPPLALPDLDVPPRADVLANNPAVALFVDRARAVRPSFKLTDGNAGSIAAICVQLDGLPLAIELVAAYAKLFAPQALLTQLDIRLKSATGKRDLPARQQTLWNAIGWSFDQLSPGEQALFARLAVFVGGCTLESAEAVCNAEDDLEIDVANGIILLLEKSLLYQEDDDADDEARFIMLHTIREYGMERLAERGEAEHVRRQHTRFFLALAEAAEPELRGRQQAHWLARLDEEHDNLNAALGWSRADADVETGLRMAGALWWFWHRRGYMNEGRDWLEEVLRDSVGQTPIRAKVLHGAGVLAWLQGDYLVAKTRLEESFRIWEEEGNRRALAYTLSYLGLVALHQNNIEQARSQNQESLAIFQDIGDQWGVAFTLRNLAIVTLAQGDIDGARSLQERSLQLFREIEEQWGLVVVLNDLGETARSQGDYERATILYEECLVLSRQMKDRWIQAIALLNLSHVAQHQGNYDQARKLVEESLKIWQDLGNKPAIALCLAALAGIAVKVGRVKWAVRLFGSVEALFDTIGRRPSSIDQIEYNRNVETARVQLAESAFAALWAKGRAMKPEQVISHLWNDKKPSKEGMSDSGVY